MGRWLNYVNAEACAEKHRALPTCIFRSPFALAAGAHLYATGILQWGIPSSGAFPGSIRAGHPLSDIKTSENASLSDQLAVVTLFHVRSSAPPHIPAKEMWEFPDDARHKLCSFWSTGPKQVPGYIGLSELRAAHTRSGLGKARIACLLDWDVRCCIDCISICAHSPERGVKAEPLTEIRLCVVRVSGGLPASAVQVFATCCI